MKNNSNLGLSGVVIVSALLFSCGGQTTPDEIGRSAASEPHEQAAQSLLEQFSGKPAEHACQHAQLGPFADVVASRTVPNAPDVSAVHHTYRVLLTPGSSSGWVSYRAEREGAQAIGIGTGALLRVIDSNEVALAYDTHQFADCPKLDFAHLLSFERDQTYWLDAFVQDSHDH
jgi:hypothetical protein